MATKSYQEQVEEDILFHLAAEVQDTQMIADKTGIPYASVRKSMVKLINEGKIVKFDRRDRGARYSLSPDNGGKASIANIPVLRFAGQSAPLTELYDPALVEKIAIDAINDLFRAWTTCAVTARRLHDGMPPATFVKKINRDRVQLTQSRSNLEQVVFLINQFLDNDKLWDPAHLTNFPDDERWEEFLPHLDKLYKHYYGDDK